jgi:hypothetical protein
MKNIRVLILSMLVTFLGCEMPIDKISIKDKENREFFKTVLKEEGVKFQIENENGREVIVLEKDQSKKARELLAKYSGESVQPGLSVCYDDKNLINSESNKLSSKGIKHSVVRVYAFYCITWNEEDGDKVRAVIK